MDVSVNSSDELLVTICKDCAMVKVNGRGTFKSGASLKRFGASAIQKGCTEIIFDMEGCLGMDSTFMGVLAGLAIRIQRENKGRLVALNLSERTASLLQTLGLDRLVECYGSDDVPDELKARLIDVLDLDNLELDESDKHFSLETMLVAHQDLADIIPENKTKFRDVINYLDQDLEKLKKMKI